MKGIIMKARVWLFTATTILLEILVAVMAIIVAIQVIWRYFLNSPLVWAEEFARYCLVWISFLGSAVALKEGKLAAVDIFVKKTPLLWRK
ncbi:MAG TPA: TRAP transporter small permease subunit, partial [Clostridiaceae bacterium]|nr:TRAP transporter small permease subunit [Clostridiaceae bacterium]